MLVKESLAERIVSRIIDKVSTLRFKLPEHEYRAVINRLASLKEEQEATDYFNDPGNEGRDPFGINPQTGHIYDCTCNDCLGFPAANHAGAI